jgi:hypothetical protein
MNLDDRSAPKKRRWIFLSRLPVYPSKKPASGKTRFLPLLILLVVLTGMICGTTAAPTTSVRIAKIATDGVTVMNETTVDIPWMESHLPVQGDGTVHYYHQGPVFVDDKESQWDANETTNFKDRGAVKGTAIRDLCELVGGMIPGDAVVISAVDGYRIDFPYQNIYEPQARQGLLVLCWYNGEETSVGERQGVGYPPAYYNGMRLVFFADTSTNKEQKHVFGNNDMREVMPREKIYLFDDLYPSTSGYTVKWVDEITIYSGGISGNATLPAKSAGPLPAKTTTIPAKSPLPEFLPLTAFAGIALFTALRRPGCTHG